MTEPARAAAGSPVSGHPDWLEYPVWFDPSSAERALRMAKANRTMRIVSLVISIGIAIAVYFIWRDTFSELYWWFAGAGLCLPLGFLAYAILVEIQARRAAAQVVPSMALGLGRESVWISGVVVPWSQVARFWVRPPRWGAASTLMLTQLGGGTSKLPLDHLAVSAGTLDSAVRALSAGKVWIDFSALEV